MLIDLITSEEKQMIEDYITECVNWEHEGNRASVEHVLRLWDEAKSDYLSSIFPEGKLITTTPIEFKESISEVERKIDNLWADPNKYVEYFYHQFRNLYRDSDWEYYSAMLDILNTSSLATNRIELRQTIHFPLPNGKTLKAETGMKTGRFLRQMAKAFDMPMDKFDIYQNAISTCLQTKTLSGELCLSIHPLDFMTMSDNTIGWSSCMSWSGDGEYRQGTVEMMNSPCVVVGYLRSEKDMPMADGAKWNNKKWRCLFIVDPNFIISVKSYPYFNDALTCEAISQIEKMMGWEKVEPAEYNLRNGYKNINIYFCSDHMYNDFGATSHYIAINPAFTANLTGPYCYSGASECMWCGKEYDIPHSNSLTCSECGHFTVCAECGEVIEPGCGCWDDECCYCEDCWENMYSWDEISGRDTLDENMSTVWLSKSNKKFLMSGLSVETNINGERWGEHFHGDVHIDSETGAYFVYPNQVTMHTLSHHFYADREEIEFFSKMMKPF